jgi:4-amino-4-deoxy-L-arabinose transferase-like glycosyltransferase
VLDRLTLMRLASALFVGFAALCVALFVRELLPSRPWAWVAGGMVAAFQPMLGFIGGGVNNDSLLFAAAAALLLVVARILRRGLDARLGAAAGAAIAVGVLTKATMIGLVPLACVGLLLAALGNRRGGRRIPWGGLAAFVLVAAVPILAYSVANELVWDRGSSLLGGSSLGGGGGGASSGSRAPVGGGTGVASGAVSVGPAPWKPQELLTYTWQFYFPRLPFMDDKFGTDLPVWEVWFKGWLGRFGWQDTEFSNAFYRAAFKIWLGVVALALLGLWRHRAALRRRWAEIVTYASGAAGVVAALHYVGYDYWLKTGVGFEQARYLLVLLPLYAGFAAIAAVAGGRRLGPVLAGTLVVLAFGNSLAGILVTIARYYG